ncbi:MAG: type III-B CRISPR module-associated protein Cmr5 [Pseudomonadota bacterium]
MSNTLAQQRSAFALTEVRHLRGNRRDFAKFVAGLPAMILQNGFAQALAFLLAKGTDKNGKPNHGDKHLQAFDIIVRWFNDRDIVKQTEHRQVMAALSEMPQGDYLRAQDEALALLEWVKRYANAGLFSDQVGGHNETQDDRSAQTGF